MKNSKRLLALAVSAALAAPMAAHATNGMNLEGYGPIAAGMGGASMAYDNGTAAMMNNPATLGMMDDGNRLDVAIGVLRPDVTTEMQTPMGTQSFESSATSFLMPAVGWAKKDGKNTYGVGLFAQGGMGATYDGTSSPGGAMSAGWMTMSSPMYNAADMNTYSPCDVVSAMAGTTCDGGAASNAALAAAGLDTAAGTASALVDKSEVGVGRLLFPFAREVNDKLNVAGSIDFVWAGMDLRMAMPGMMMGDMMMNPASTAGKISGTLADTFGGMMASSGGPIYGMNYGYLDFSDDNDYTGEAMGTGFAGKLGMTYKLNDKVTVGATYHSKTSLSKLEASGAEVTMDVLMSMDGGANFSTMPMKVVGDMEVDFQWPSTMALGVAFKANDKLMIVADAKRINWSEVMTDFNMKFTVDQSASNDFSAVMPGMPNMQGQVMDMTMYQNWKDQTVVQLGAAYQVNKAVTARVGYNKSSNPVPAGNLNWLFPAVTDQAVTLGMGYAIDDASAIDVSYNHVTEVVGGGPNGFTTSMSQGNFQLMYSKKF